MTQTGQDQSQHSLELCGLSVPEWEPLCVNRQWGTLIWSVGSGMKLLQKTLRSARMSQRSLPALKISPRQISPATQATGQTEIWEEYSGVRAVWGIITEISPGHCYERTAHDVPLALCFVYSFICCNSSISASLSANSRPTVSWARLSVQTPKSTLVLLTPWFSLGNIRKFVKLQYLLLLQK